MTNKDTEHYKKRCEECRNSIALGLVYKGRVVPDSAYYEYCTKFSCYVRNNLRDIPTEEEFETRRRQYEYQKWWTEYNAN